MALIYEEGAHGIVAGGAVGGLFCCYIFGICFCLFRRYLERRGGGTIVKAVPIYVGESHSLRKVGVTEDDDEVSVKGVEMQMTREGVGATPAKLEKEMEYY